MAEAKVHYSENQLDRPGFKSLLEILKDVADYNAGPDSASTGHTHDESPLDEIDALIRRLEQSSQTIDTPRPPVSWSVLKSVIDVVEASGKAESLCMPERSSESQSAKSVDTLREVPRTSHAHSPHHGGDDYELCNTAFPAKHIAMQPRSFPSNNVPRSVYDAWAGPTIQNFSTNLAASTAPSYEHCPPFSTIDLSKKHHYQPQNGGWHTSNAVPPPVFGATSMITAEEGTSASTSRSRPVQETRRFTEVQNNLAERGWRLAGNDDCQRGEGDETRKLYASFKRQLKPKKFFRVGRVFMVLWTEPFGDDSTSEASRCTVSGLYGDLLYQKVRRFVVIAEAEQHCLAIPISSYGNKGVAKKTVTKADHGIVYIGNAPPDPGLDELPARGELPMVEIPIRITPDTRTEKLAAKSRIHYSKVYTIEHKVRAKSVGMVHERSLAALFYQTKSVWTRTPNGLGKSGIEPGTQRNEGVSGVLSNLSLQI